MIANLTSALETTTRKTTAAMASGISIRVAGIEQHPDRHEEEDGERIAQRQGVGRGLVAHVGFADHRAGEERPERERDAEDGR